MEKFNPNNQVLSKSEYDFLLKLWNNSINIESFEESQDFKDSFLQEFEIYFARQDLSSSSKKHIENLVNKVSITLWWEKFSDISQKTNLPLQLETQPETEKKHEKEENPDTVEQNKTETQPETEKSNNFDKFKSILDSLNLTWEQIFLLNKIIGLNSKDITEKTFLNLSKKYTEIIPWLENWNIKIQKTEYREEIILPIEDYIKKIVINLLKIDWEKQFNELWFDKYANQIEKALGIPDFMLNAIIERESNYWSELKSEWWSKWLTQLTNSVFDEMKDSKEKMNIFLEYFKLIPDNIIDEIQPIEAWDIFRKIKIENKIEEKDIEILRKNIKKDKSYNHVLNMIIWWSYLKYLKDNRSSWVKQPEYDDKIVQQIFSRWNQNLKNWYKENKDMNLTQEEKEWLNALINYNWNNNRIIRWETVPHKKNYWRSVFLKYKNLNEKW